MENQQLIKKDRSANSYSKIFPWTFTDLVLDRVTKESLDNILVRNNFIALPYVGSKAATRLQVPMKNRRRGIWLSYIDYAGTLTVEYYNDNNLDDNHWQDSSYWLPYNTAEFQPASVGLSALAQEVFDWINSQITAAVKLNPEDLQKNSSGQIEEANRAYDTSTFSGLGYRILRKNIQSNKNILTQSMINMPNNVYKIRYDFDLNGATINLPANSVLKFEGGQLKNGTINFNNCNIDNIGNSIILNNCTLKGSLNKQVIYSDWFYFNSDDCTDTLNDVFKISEGCRFIISEGVYKVSVKNLIGTDYADPMNTSILQPQSNSHITINGTIQLISNDRTHYNIIGIIDKDNILLDGTGEIIGDVETHTGTTGEWGHGVLISGSRNINVKDLRISYCWGDGLSVSYAEKILTDKGLVNSPYSPPEIINITNIKSSYNRRLGISIINGDGIILENSITEGNGTINGTSPKAGLDIEPNPNQSVNNVIVSGCLFYDNVVTYFPSDGLIKDEAISCIIQNSICKKQVTIGNVGKVIGCEIKYLLINGSRFVNIQNNVITEALVLSGTTITGLNVIDNTFLGLTTDGYDSCIRVSCDSFSKVNIASNNFSLCTNSNMRKLVTYTKKQTNAIDIVDSVITYDKTLTLLFYPYANFYNCEFIFSGFNIYNITSELDKYPDSCSFIGCKFAANNSSFYIRDNITDNYKITIENCEYYTKQDNPTDFINYIGHTIALDLVVLNNKGKSVFLKNDIDEAHKRPIINNNYNGHRFYNITNKRPEYYYNNNWWDSCGYNVNENRNSDGTLIEKVRIVSDSSKIVNSNIIYVIVSDIDLQGETLTIPAGCTLDFQGGSIINGTIIGNNTKIKAGLQKIFNNDIILTGTWNVTESFVEWAGCYPNNTQSVDFKTAYYVIKPISKIVQLNSGTYYSNAGEISVNSIRGVNDLSITSSIIQFTYDSGYDYGLLFGNYEGGVTDRLEGASLEGIKVIVSSSTIKGHTALMVGACGRCDIKSCNINIYNSKLTLEELTSLYNSKDRELIASSCNKAIAFNGAVELFNVERCSTYGDIGIALISGTDFLTIRDSIFVQHSNGFAGIAALKSSSDLNIVNNSYDLGLYGIYLGAALSTDSYVSFSNCTIEKGRIEQLKTSLVDADNRAAGYSIYIGQQNYLSSLSIRNILLASECGGIYIDSVAHAGYVNIQDIKIYSDATPKYVYNFNKKDSTVIFPNLTMRNFSSSNDIKISDGIGVDIIEEFTASRTYSAPFSGNTGVRIYNKNPGFFNTIGNGEFVQKKSIVYNHPNGAGKYFQIPFTDTSTLSLPNYNYVKINIEYYNSVTNTLERAELVRLKDKTISIINATSNIRLESSVTLAGYYILLDSSLDIVQTYNATGVNPLSVKVDTEIVLTSNLDGTA